MNLLIEQLLDDPKGTAIGCISALAILGGLTIGIQRGAFNPDPMQQRLELKQQNHALQKQSIALANDRFHNQTIFPFFFGDFDDRSF